MARLDTFSPQIAVQVRPLYQLWRDGQTRQLQLVEERARYAKLQQSSDSELEHCVSRSWRCASSWS